MLGQLVRKELHLQKSNGLFALVVLLFWVALMAAAPFGDKRIHSLYGVQMAELLVVLETSFVGVCLAFVLPMAIGATLAAEERNAGVWDWGLSLPGSRKKQWFVKVAVGMSLTAVLAWGVLPLLDAVLYAALPHDGATMAGGAKRGLFHELHKGVGLLLLPMVLLASGAFASSLVSRPYRAFFLAIPIVVLAVGAGRLADMGALLGVPWSGEELAENGLNGMARLYAILHVVVTVGLLLWLAYLNFRFDHFRKRRLMLELATLVVVVTACCGLLLNLATNPKPLLSGRWEDVASLIQERRSEEWGDSLPPFDRDSIVPLMVARRDPPWWAGGTSLEGALDYDFARRPKTQDPHLEYIILYRWGIVGELLQLDVRTGDVRSYNTATGLLAGVLPFVLPRIHLTPVPALNLILLHRETMRIVRESPVLHSESCVVRDVGGKEATVREVQRLSDSLPFYSGPVMEPLKGCKKGSREHVVGYALLRRDEDRWQLVDLSSHYPYAISPDGRWFTRGSMSVEGDSWLPGMYGGSSRVQVVSMDGGTSFTLRGGRLRLSVCWPTYRCWRQGLPDGYQMVPWASSDSTIPPRPYGDRLVLFQRIHTVAAPDRTGRVTDSGIPERIDVGVLDLETGRETVALRLTPESAYLRDRYDRSKRFWWRGKAPNRGEQPAPMHGAEDFAFIRSAPERPRWAVYYDGWLTVFDAFLDDASSEPTRFREVRRVDLRGIVSPDYSGFMTFRFVDDSTILFWNESLGVFRIDLEGRQR